MFELSKRFPKKRAFITGAGSGLGEAIALALAAEGWHLALNDLREEAVVATAEKVRNAGGTAHTFPFDVGDRAAFAKAVDEAVARFDGIDLVVNNAGVAGGGEVGEFPLEDWDWLYRINVMGVVNGCHLFAPVLKRQKSGHILNVASAAALVPVPRMAAYCSAKAAVKMLSEVLQHELVEHDVGISVLMPDFFRTNLFERTRGTEAMRAKKLITASKYTADDVARFALEGVGAGKLYLPFPKRLELVWWVLRQAPEKGLALVRAGARRATRR